MVVRPISMGTAQDTASLSRRSLSTRGERRRPVRVAPAPDDEQAPRESVIRFRFRVPAQGRAARPLRGPDGVIVGLAEQLS